MMGMASRMHQSISEVPVEMCAEQDMNQNIRRDLIALLEERECAGEADAQEDRDCTPKKRRKPPSAYGRT